MSRCSYSLSSLESLKSGGNRKSLDSMNTIHQPWQLVVTERQCRQSLIHHCSPAFALVSALTLAFQSFGDLSSDNRPAQRLVFARKHRYMNKAQIGARHLSA